MPLKNISTNDDILILRYLYEELTPEEEASFQKRLSQEALLAERYFEFLHTIKLLNKIQEAPHEETVLNILNHSKNFKI